MNCILCVEIALLKLLHLFGKWINLCSIESFAYPCIIDTLSRAGCALSTLWQNNLSYRGFVVLLLCFILRGLICDCKILWNIQDYGMRFNEYTSENPIRACTATHVEWLKWLRKTWTETYIHDKIRVVSATNHNSSHGDICKYHDVDKT